MVFRVSGMGSLVGGWAEKWHHRTDVFKDSCWYIKEKLYGIQDEAEDE